MTIYEELTTSLLEAELAELPPAQRCFADCNLPRETLAWLATRKPAGLLYVDAVSVAKAVRIKNLLPDLDGLFCKPR